MKCTQIHQPSSQRWVNANNTDFVSQIYRSIKSLIRIVKAIYVCVCLRACMYIERICGWRSVPPILIETCAVSITFVQFTLRTLLCLKQRREWWMPNTAQLNVCLSILITFEVRRHFSGMTSSIIKLMQTKLPKTKRTKNICTKCMHTNRILIQRRWIIFTQIFKFFIWI